MSDEQRPINIGVGMPAGLYLHVWSAFGQCPHLVGSALYGKQWRDVDVRLILPDEDYEAIGLGDPKRAHQSPMWVSLCLAYSALGKAMTGLPIDFQIQQMTLANEQYSGARSSLGITAVRYEGLAKLGAAQQQAEGE